MKANDPIRGGSQAFDSVSNSYSFRQDFGGYGSIGGTSRLFGCGIGGLRGFNNVRLDMTSFADKAEFIAAIYRELHGAGNAIYCITDSQLTKSPHLALLEIGSTEIANFPNLCHAPSQMHLFLVNVHNAVNKFCDVHGTPYTEAPTEVVPYEYKPDFNVAMALNRIKP